MSNQKTPHNRTLSERQAVDSSIAPAELAELREILRRIVVEPTNNETSTADIAVGFRSSTDVATIVTKLVNLFENQATRIREEEFVPEDSNLCASCGFAEWRHNKRGLSCKQFKPNPSPAEIEARIDAEEWHLNRLIGLSNGFDLIEDVKSATYVRLAQLRASLEQQKGQK